MALKRSIKQQRDAETQTLIIDYFMNGFDVTDCPKGRRMKPRGRSSCKTAMPRLYGWV